LLLLTISPANFIILTVMTEQMQAGKVRLFRGTLCHVEGALNNQRAHLYLHPGDSLVTEPVNGATIRDIRVARKNGTAYVTAPIPDAIHAIEGLRRQAKSLRETAERGDDLYDIAYGRGKALSALANMMVDDVMSAYELTPGAQYELLASVQSTVEG
jgi:hypothetical protein